MLNYITWYWILLLDSQLLPYLPIYSKWSSLIIRRTIPAAGLGTKRPHSIRVISFLCSPENGTEVPVFSIFSIVKKLNICPYPVSLFATLYEIGFKEKCNTHKERQSKTREKKPTNHIWKPRFHVIFFSNWHKNYIFLWNTMWLSQYLHLLCNVKIVV